MNLNSNLNSSIKINGDSEQFLSFTIGSETYGVDIMTILEIRGWVDTTPLPKAPEYMVGVLNLRGMVVPIFDLRLKLGLGKTEPDTTNVVIIISVAEKKIGILVDTVSDILTVNMNDISSPPDVDSNIEERFISGLLTSSDENMVILLNVESLFSKEEVEQFKDSTK